MVSVEELRAKVAAYLQGRTSLDEFDEWFSANTWNMHRDNDPEAQRIAGAIELLLAEHSSGHLTDSQLLVRLLPLADPKTAFIPSADHVEASTTSRGSGGYSRYELPSRKTGRYSSQAGSLEEPARLHRKVTGTLEIGTGRTLNRPA
jgi:hypothetical protein